MRGWVAVAVNLLAVAAARPAGSMTHVTIPARLVVDNHSFDGSPAGFRRYLETIRWKNPELYAQLSPDVGRLESRASIALKVLITGFAASAAAGVAGTLWMRDCPQPAATDPNLPADTAAWQACNHANLVHFGVLALASLTLITATFVSELAIKPSLDDVRDLVNRHNRTSPQPMQLKIGYDPVRHLAGVGVNISF